MMRLVGWGGERLGLWVVGCNRTKDTRKQQAADSKRHATHLGLRLRLGAAGGGGLSDRLGGGVGVAAADALGGG